MRLALLIIFIISAIVGYVAGAATSNPAYADTSKEYELGYTVKITHNNNTVIVADTSTNATIKQGPRVGAVEIVNDLGNASSVIVPPPRTVTYVENHTVTKTITKTITLPNGETKAVTEVRTVTIPQEESKINSKLLGLGVVAFLLLILVAKR